MLAFPDESLVEMDSLAGIPRVTLFKQPGSKYLLARIILIDDLFHYQYPFRLPDLFEKDISDQKLTKYENLVRVECIKTLSSKEVEKQFISEISSTKYLIMMWIYQIQIFQIS